MPLRELGRNYEVYFFSKRIKYSNNLRMYTALPRDGSMKAYIPRTHWLPYFLESNTLYPLPRGTLMKFATDLIPVHTFGSLKKFATWKSFALFSALSASLPKDSSAAL